MAQDDSLSEAEELWRHKGPTSSRMWTFLQHVNQKHDLALRDFSMLYKWSIDHTADFWEDVWHCTGVKASQSFQSPIVDESLAMFPRPPFAAAARLNFAENVLFPASSPDPDSPAIIAATETTRSTVSWASLRSRVARCQAGLLAIGVKEGDRVAGLTGNHTDAVVAMLAATSLGALWTAISPDSGVTMVLDRLKQIEPKVLFADASQEYNGKKHDVLPKVKEIVSELPTLSDVVILPSLPANSSMTLESLSPKDGRALSFSDFENLGPSEAKLEFKQLPPDHPVYILYSSGTTGAPKCIVHGCIGTLLQHKKEHELHCDLKPGDRLFYFTTCTWMMWHWLVSALASGVTLILYDGSPMRYTTSPIPLSQSTTTISPSSSSQPNDLALPHLITELQITHFGTSAKYLSLLEQKSLFPQSPPHSLPLSSTLRAVYNTASPLAPSTFKYVYRAFGPNINLASITGGTDILSLFGAPCPLVPVYAGEVQAPGLGMAVAAFDAEGRDVSGESGAPPGDLTCTKVFPAQPVGFWPLGDANAQERYRGAYFARFADPTDADKPIWHHGDFVRFHRHACPSPSASSSAATKDAANTYTSLTMLGRSDTVLNPAGIRFGSSELYNLLLSRFPSQISDSLAVGLCRAHKREVDERVVLFLKMAPDVAFTEELAKEVKAEIRKGLSARHVPAFVARCDDVPVTVNGKKVEGEVRSILNSEGKEGEGTVARGKVAAAVANPECLEFYRKWARSVD